MFEAVFIKDEANNTLTITRRFAAPKSKVWKAWTDPQILEQWWAPQPWKAVTKSFEFKEGGKWLYYMQGPKNDKNWSVVEYKTIDPENSYTAVDAFADEEGNKSSSFPITELKNEYTETDGVTQVKITSKYPSSQDIDRVLEMGLAEGMAMAFRSLDEILTK